MSSGNDDLLARLNALKPSSVRLDNGPNAPAVDVGVKQPVSVEDKLADRLKGLRSGSSSGAKSSSVGRDTADGLISRTKDEVATERDPITNWQSNDEEPDLAQLLAELGPDDQWKLDPEDPKNINSLLKEARDALPKDGAENKEQEGQPTAEPNPSSTLDIQEGEQNDSHQTEDQRDDAEADDYVSRILAELEFDKKHGIENEEAGDATDDDEGHSALELPATPSAPPKQQERPMDKPPSYEDSELASRFSGLALNLPSTPSGPPSARAKATVKSKLDEAKQKTNLPVYTDEDIDSWCCICNDDGTVRCLGCDGDIYCDGCWTEGHGTGPGQERGHKAIKYNRKSGEKKKRKVAAS